MHPPLPIDWNHLREIEAAPWDRIPGHEGVRGETDKAFAYFVAYRDLGHQRALHLVAKQFDVSPHTIAEFAQKWWWRKRVEAWDDYLNEVAKQSQVDATAEMNERHARIAMTGLRTIALRLVGLEPGVDPNFPDGIKAINPEMLGAADISRLTDVLTKVERLARESEGIRLGTESLEPPTTVKLAFDVVPQFPSSEPKVATPVIDGGSIRVDPAREVGPVVAELPPASPEEASENELPPTRPTWDRRDDG